MLHCDYYRILPRWVASSCVLLLLLAFGFSSLRAQSPDAWKDRFTKEAPQKWEEYRRHAARFQGTLTQLCKDGEQVVQQARFEVKQNAACRLGIYHSLLEQSPESEAFGYNSDYAFSVARKKPDQLWVLNRLEVLREEGDLARSATYKEVADELRLTRVLVLVASTFELSELIAQPTFRLVRAAPIAREGEQLIEVEFDNAHPVDSKPLCSFQGGTLVLDPQRFWCVRSYDLQIKFRDMQGTEKCEVHLRGGGAGCPIPERVVTTQELQPTPEGHRGRSSVVTREYDLQEPATLPGDDQFRLSAFGLPEPALPRRPVPWYLYALAGAGLCLVLMFTAKRLARRGGAGS